MTEPIQHLPPEDEADLAALADGSLYGARRAAFEARLAREPDLGAALARQRSVVARLAVTAPRAPLSLRMYVEELEAAQPPVARSRPWRLWPAGAVAFAAGVALFVALLAAPGPGIHDVLAVAERPATAPAALERGFEGVRFPRYEKWRASGERSDVVDGRRVRTVFYESRDGRVIAYAIVAGPALSDSEALRAVRGEDGVVAVTWNRGGRTCVIVSAGGDARGLARLAVR
jgi:anti-sigma factor RsiW